MVVAGDVIEEFLSRFGERGNGVVWVRLGGVSEEDDNCEENSGGDEEREKEDNEGDKARG